MLKFPLLALNHAEKIISDSFGSSPSEVKSLLATEHPQMELSEFPVREASSKEIKVLRDNVLNIAIRFGFPSQSTQTNLIEFDRVLSVEFPNLLQVPPAHARSGKMWTFLTCVVLLDVAIWRFPNTTENSKFSRYVGNLNKNTFARLWWRGFQVGKLSEKLEEDNSVALMERTRLSGDARVARAVIRALEKSATKVIERGKTPAMGKMKAYRSIALELRALGTVVSYASLSDSALDSIMLGYAERLLEPK